MNAKTLIASALLSLSASAGFAAEATQFNPQASTLTRAEVRAELARASAAGELDVRGETYGSITPADANAMASGRTRAEVRAEAQGHALSRGDNTYYTGG